MQRSKVQESFTTETAIFAAMQSIPEQRVSAVLGQIRKSIVAREEYEADKRDGEQSKDFEQVRKLDNRNVARFMVAIGLNPEPYINSPSYSPESFEAKSRIPAEAKTGNLKGYKKFRETAEYFSNGSKLESVVKTSVACMIISSQYHVVIPRDVCERFLNSVPLNRVSDELIEALDQYRAKHMTGGAATQTSQCTLQLANIRAAKLVMNGRFKDFALDVDSPVIESFAQRFGLVAQLERARSYRASVNAEALSE